MTSSIIDLMGGLARADRRGAAAAALAARLGVEALLAFVRDEPVNAFVPAPGFPQTIAGGAGWHALLGACAQPGVHDGAVVYPRGAQGRPACAIAGGSAALVLVGPRPGADDVAAVSALLPLLDGLLSAEQAVRVALAQVVVAQEGARTAKTLAELLDRSRADLNATVIETGRLNRELQETDQRKDEFLAMLAHELRSPLSPMATALALAQRRLDETSEARRPLQVIERQMRLLTRLVDDLLDVSRITRGRIDLHLEPVSLKTILQAAVETVQPSVDARRHTLTVTQADSALVVNADAARLVQVFGNLLNNSAKYTSHGGHIDVNVRADGDVAVVSVVDDGHGMAEDMLPRVFDLFAQAPRTLDRSDGGLGIGLRLVKSIVELHGGTVTAHSDGLGRGSRFEVRLPLATAAAAKGVAATSPEAPDFRRPRRAPRP